MKAFKLKKTNSGLDEIKIVYAENALAVIRALDLCSRENCDTRIFELAGEQLALAMENYVPGEELVG